MKKQKLVQCGLLAVLAIVLGACSSDSSGGSSGSGTKNWCYTSLGSASCVSTETLTMSGTTCSQISGTLVENCNEYGFENCYMDVTGTCSPLASGQCQQLYGAAGGTVVESCEEVKPSSSSKGPDNSGTKNWCYISLGATSCVSMETLTMSGTTCAEVRGTLVENCSEYGFENCYVDITGTCSPLASGQCQQLYGTAGGKVVESCEDALSSSGGNNNRSSNSGGNNNSSSSGNNNSGQDEPVNCYILNLETDKHRCSVLLESECDVYGADENQYVVRTPESCTDIATASWTTAPKYCNQKYWNKTNSEYADPACALIPADVPAVPDCLELNGTIDYWTWDEDWLTPPKYNVVHEIEFRTSVSDAPLSADCPRPE